MVDRSGRDSREQSSVLLVDDGSARSTLHRKRLERHGYHVISASDMDAALTVARQAPPLIIFLTVERPGSGRTSFLQALRRDDRTRHVPVAVLPGGHDDAIAGLGLSRVGRDVW